jgi:hypothetical protein
MSMLLEKQTELGQSSHHEYSKNIFICNWHFLLNISPRCLLFSKVYLFAEFD